MALRGTLKDFGIADIFQLIGHQGKTGTLTVRNRDQEVHIHFHGGSVARADSATRSKRDLLGSLLVRAEVISEEQLEEALDTQKRTLKRLGDVLIEMGALDAKTLNAFARLQSTETIYRLFLWDSGMYEFKQADVQIDDPADLLRSENVLMEGFRQVDEWPMIRRKITGYGLTFEKLEDLDALTAAAGGDEDDFGLDDAFGDFGESSGASGDPRLKNIGQNERSVYHLVAPGRDVQKIIDLSRLGEFETCKALLALLDNGIVAPATEVHDEPSAEATVGGIHATPRSSWAPAVTRVALTAALVAAIGVGVWYLGSAGPRAWLAALRSSSIGYTPVALQSAVGEGAMARLRAALEVYRAETGTYPESLDALVEVGLIEERELSYPWQLPYAYAVEGEGYELVRPLY